MTAAPSLSRATCAALALPDAGTVPEWVQLLPTINGKITTHDGRGPYIVRDPAAIIAASFADPRDAGGLLIDENHALDHAAPVGGPSPARGRITKLEARADGIWGQVDWTASGRALMADRSYRGISPVIAYVKETGEIAAILRAGLSNYANLRGLTALNSEENPPMMGKIAKMLGLAEDATEEAIMAAITKMKGEKTDTAMNAAMDQVATLVKAPQGDTKAIVAGVELAVGGKDQLIALQSQLTTQAAELTAIKTATARAASEAYIDAEIKGLRIGLNAQNREMMIALHMEKPDTAKALIEGMPKATATHTGNTPPAAVAGIDTALNAEGQGQQIADKARALMAQRQTAGAPITYEQAVMAVAEGKQ